MDAIKGLPKLAYSMDYDIRNGCVFDPKIFEKYLVSGSYKVQAGYRGGQTAIHLNPGSYIEIPVEWTNVNGWFTLAMWVYIVDDNDDSHYSVMSFNTNNGWKHIYYYPWQQTGFANGNRITNKGSGIYGQWGWRRLNVEINPTNGLIYWTWNVNYFLGQAGFGAFNTVSAIRIGPHTSTGKYFNSIAIDNLTLIYDEKYPHGQHSFAAPLVDYKNTTGTNLFNNNATAYGIRKQGDE
jgi:hypothetical protein